MARKEDTGLPDVLAEHAISHCPNKVAGIMVPYPTLLRMPGLDDSVDLNVMATRPEERACLWRQRPLGAQDRARTPIGHVRSTHNAVPPPENLMPTIFGCVTLQLGKAQCRRKPPNKPFLARSSASKAAEMYRQTTIRESKLMRESLRLLKGDTRWSARCTTKIRPSTLPTRHLPTSIPTSIKR